jgi:hypothetical protein
VCCIRVDDKRGGTKGQEQKEFHCLPEILMLKINIETQKESKLECLIGVCGKVKVDELDYLIGVVKILIFVEIFRN